MCFQGEHCELLAYDYKQRWCAVHLPYIAAHAAHVNCKAPAIACRTRYWFTCMGLFDVGPSMLHGMCITAEIVCMHLEPRTHFKLLFDSLTYIRSEQYNTVHLQMSRWHVSICQVTHGITRCLQITISIILPEVVRSLVTKEGYMVYNAVTSDGIMLIIRYNDMIPRTLNPMTQPGQGH